MELSLNVASARLISRVPPCNLFRKALPAQRTELRERPREFHGDTVDAGDQEKRLKLENSGRGILVGTELPAGKRW